jgi:hypothetical protein
LSNRKSIFNASKARWSGAGALLAVLLLLPGASCEDPGRASAGGEVPEAGFHGRILPDGQTIEIVASIPPRHHAYLDAGDEGNLIPIGFDWQDLTPEPVALSMPTGERDEDVKARVLRGDGRFQFQHSTVSPGVQVRVRSQICDEDRGVCYRPTWNEVEL